jgi:WD40 repeat protein
MWDVETGTERATLTGHTNPVNAVAMTEIEGRPHAVTTSDDDMVRVWDLDVGPPKGLPGINTLV